MRGVAVSICAALRLLVTLLGDSRGERINICDIAAYRLKIGEFALFLV